MKNIFTKTFKLRIFLKFIIPKSKNAFFKNELCIFNKKKTRLQPLQPRLFVYALL